MPKVNYWKMPADEHRKTGSDFIKQGAYQAKKRSRPGGAFFAAMGMFHNSAAAGEKYEAIRHLKQVDEIVKSWDHVLAEEILTEAGI